MKNKNRGELGQFHIDGRVKYKLIWSCHMVRIGESRKPRKIMEALPEVRKTKCRKPMDVIEKTTRKNWTGETELRKIAGDMRDWRTRIKKTRRCEV